MISMCAALATVLITVAEPACGWGIARAQSDSGHGQPRAIGAGGAPAQGAPVIFGADTLFRLYAALGPFSAEARAAAVEDRLPQLVHAIAEGDSVVVTDRLTESEVSVRDRLVMTVLDADAGPVGESRASLARTYADRLQVALHAAAERTSVRALILAISFALIATSVLTALLWLLQFGFPRLRRRIEALPRGRLRGIRIQQFELMSARRLSALLVSGARAVRILLTLLLLYFYVPLVLSFFPWTAGLSRAIIGYAVRPFVAAWTGFLAYLPNLFYLAAGVIIVRYVLALLRLLFGAVSTGAITLRNFYAEWADPTYKIVRVLVLAFAATVLYPYLPGANSDAFKGVSIFLGIFLSLGSSTAIGNMVAGVVLTYTRAFQLGDRVKIGETVGDVVEKTLLVTRVRTIKNVAVTIPNGTVLSNQVVNYSTLAASHRLILHTSVTIGYSAPWRRVHELLLDAARRTDHVTAAPEPFVLQTELDDFYVRYEVNAYTDRPDLMAVISSELHRNIQETFNAGGVEITSPHYRALRDGNEVTIPKVQAPASAPEPASRSDDAPTPASPPRAEEA